MESEAVKHLAVVLNLAPDHPKGNNTVANWLALRGDRQGAAEHYARAGAASDMGVSALPPVAAAAHGLPHATDKRLSSALTARYLEPGYGHAPPAATDSASRMLADRLSAPVSSSSSTALSRSFGVGALPLVPSNDTIQPHSEALVATNPVPALLEARHPFGVGRAASSTPPSAFMVERAAAMTTSVSSPLKHPMESRRLLMMTETVGTARRAAALPTTSTAAGADAWKTQRMRNDRGKLAQHEAEDSSQRSLMLSPLSHEPHAYVGPGLPGAANASQPKHMAGSEPAAIAQELSSLRRAGHLSECEVRGWLPVPSLPS